MPTRAASCIGISSTRLASEGLACITCCRLAAPPADAAAADDAALGGAGGSDRCTAVERCVTAAVGSAAADCGAAATPA